MLILENPVNHQYFFSTVVPVSTEVSFRQPAHQGSMLSSKTRQRYYRKTGHKTREPVGFQCIHDHVLTITHVHVAELDK